VILHLELSVDLRDKWRSHKAAIAALNHICDPSSFERSYSQRVREISSIQVPTGGINVEVLAEYVELSFKYNAALKWLVLHTPQCKLYLTVSVASMQHGFRPKAARF